MDAAEYPSLTPLSKLRFGEADISRNQSQDSRESWSMFMAIVIVGHLRDVQERMRDVPQECLM